MHWRYAHATRTPEATFENLLALFRRLLVVMDGDVEAALQYLEDIGDRYGLWHDRYGMDEFREWLERRGEIARTARGALRLTKRGERALRRQALEDVFQKMTRHDAGEHRLPDGGGAGEPTDETRAWAFGDTMDALDANRTLSNWLHRTGGEGLLSEEDLEVRDREFATSCATVLLIDVSHSMTLYGEDRITPAKRVALALTEMILTRFPMDTIDVVLFGDTAETVPLERLPYLSNGPFHTNTRAGLIRAQDLLMRRKGVNRQIVMLTDGKPSAIHDHGSLYKNPFGLDPVIVNKTLEEGVRCRRRGIQVTTFMLTSDPHLGRFVERFTQACRGRAYFAESARLEGFVLVDFLRNRRRKVR